MTARTENLRVSVPPASHMPTIALTSLTQTKHHLCPGVKQGPATRGGKTHHTHICGQPEIIIVESRADGPA